MRTSNESKEKHQIAKINKIADSSKTGSSDRKKRTSAKPFPALTPKKLLFWRSEAARLQAEVDAGSVSALWKLARLYEDGRGVERNWKRAFELRRRAADAGDPDGLTWLGYSYDYGIGVPFNSKDSFDFYLKALKTKKFESRGLALAGVGWAYFNGEGASADPKKAFETFWEARDANVGFVCSGLSDCYRSGVGVEIDETQENVWATKAADLWRREASLGNAVALNCLADFYSEGRGVESTGEKAFESTGENAFEAAREKAFEAARISADAGFGAASYRVALNYEYVRDDVKKAFEYYRKSAETGFPNAFYRVGLARLTGSGTKIDFRAAFRSFQRGAELGVEYARFWLGRCYWEGWGCRRDETRAVDCWRRSAENGCMVAQNRFAEYLEVDAAAENGGNVDWNEATRWRLEAARQGIPDAQLAVGYAFNNGLGVEKDAKAAVFWYRQAAESGFSPGAKYNLSICYEEGEGVERDLGEAVRLMNEAADDGWAPAQHAIGLKLYSGEGGERDRRRAARLFGDAAAQGFAPALANFAKCCESGAGVAQNLEAAEFFLRLAAENDAFAASVLGERFAEGEGVPENPRFAAFWFQKAADGGDSDGARRLAFCFWEGDGVARNRAKAVEYWNRAAAVGDFDALEELARASAAKEVAAIFTVDSNCAAGAASKSGGEGARVDSRRRRALKKAPDAV